MKLKKVVGFSLIAFIASMSILLVVGLVLSKPSATTSFQSLPSQVPVASESPSADGKVYCGGKQPCYGKSTLAQHATTGNCWGFNADWMVNLTGYAPVHPNGPQYVDNNLFCGKDVHGALDGSVAIGYTHVHQNSTQSNTTSSILSSYRVGYYDPNKP